MLFEVGRQRRNQTLQYIGTLKKSVPGIGFQGKKRGGEQAVNFRHRIKNQGGSELPDESSW